MLPVILSPELTGRRLSCSLTLSSWMVIHWDFQQKRKNFPSYTFVNRWLRRKWRHVRMTRVSSVLACLPSVQCLIINRYNSLSILCLNNSLLKCELGGVWKWVSQITVYNFGALCMVWLWLCNACELWTMNEAYTTLLYNSCKYVLVA